MIQIISNPRAEIQQKKSVSIDNVLELGRNECNKSSTIKTLEHVIKLKRGDSKASLNRNALIDLEGCNNFVNSLFCHLFSLVLPVRSIFELTQHIRPNADGKIARIPAAG